MAKYSFELKLNAVLDYEKGSRGYQTIANIYHVNSFHSIKDWVDIYRAFGSRGLQRKRQNTVYDTQFKLNAVNLYLTSEKSYREITMQLGMTNRSLLARWVLGYTADRENVHDSRAFFDLYAKLTKKFPTIDTIVADAGYKTPAIAKRLIDDGRTGLFPYTRPRGKKDLFRKREFNYDYQKNTFTCPNGKELTYRTTRRDGYQEYRTCKANCQICPMLQNCTTSQTQCKIV